MHEMTIDRNCLVDLHLHLDGSISPSMARRLAKLGGQELLMSDSELEGHLCAPRDCDDLNQYLATFVFALALLQTREQLSECTRLLTEQMGNEGYLYAEIRFAPQSHGRLGLSQREAVEAVLKGIAQAPFSVGVILCCMRGDDTHEANVETVRLAAEYRDRGVVGLDLAGAEGLFPTRDYRELFELAQQLGVNYTIHAGEAAGAESVREALSFGTRRLGHGVRCLEDPALVERIAQEQIALEACPTSEIQTSIYSCYEEFPLRELLDAGVCLTINSDNLSVSRTNVRQELEHLQKDCGLRDEEVPQLLINAIQASFADEALKAELVGHITEAFR